MIYPFVLVVTATVALAMVNWRAALYVCIVLDVLRDPVRKLTVGNSVWITQSVNVAWVAIALSVLMQERRRIREFVCNYPQLRNAAILLCVALVPGAVVSITGYDGGWMLAILGGGSYLAVVPGILVGYAFARGERDIIQFMAVYCLVNSVAFIGSLLELWGWTGIGLGGIRIAWVRFCGDDAIRLICGFYRGPDVMGLHAAMVCLFAITLGMVRRKTTSRIWYLVVLWAAISLLLCGRRKMVAMPFVFAASYLYFHLRYGRGMFRAAGWMLVGCMLVGLVFCFATDLGLSAGYGDYASSIVDEGGQRVWGSMLGVPMETLRQFGILGRGLGTATQGAYHLVGTHLTWQEDGFGRLFAELGVVGVALVAVGALRVVRCCKGIIGTPQPRNVLLRWQIALISMLLANAACFIISHQAYSGDPTAICFTLLLLGSLLAISGKPETTRHTTRTAVVPQPGPVCPPGRCRASALPHAGLQ